MSNTDNTAAEQAPVKVDREGKSQKTRFNCATSNSHASILCRRGESLYVNCSNEKW